MLTTFFKKITGIKFTLLLIIIYLSLFASSNAQEIEWQNTIGGSGSDRLQSIQQTADGGYILGGWSPSNISGDKTENSNGLDDFWIVKTDAAGNIQWQNTIGGSDDDELYSIQQTSDGGYILGGLSLSNISGDKTENSNGLDDFWIVKTDAAGNIQWQNTIGGSGIDRLFCIQQTTDGGYILGGCSNSYISGDKTENNWDPSLITYDYWIIKTDATGNIQWQNTIGGNDWDELRSIQQASDGGYILGGWSKSNISGDKMESSIGLSDYWIIKTDAIGNIQWQNTIGGINAENLYSVRQTTDGGYILGGWSGSNISGDKTENNSGSYDIWIIKADANGNIQWQNTIGGVDFDYLLGIQQTADGGYILGGYSTSNISGDKTENCNGNDDYWAVKTDSVGNIQWQNSIGGSWADYLLSIQQTADGGYILGGYSASTISGDKTENCVSNSSDYWIIKLTDNYNFMTGNVFLDFNSNNAQDVSEPFLTNKKVSEQNTGRFAFSEQNGHYSIALLDSGSFTVSCNSTINYYSAVPVTHSAYFTGIQQTDSLNDFAIQPIGTFNDLCVTLTPLSAFRPGFDASYEINYENLGTTTLSPTVTIFQNNLLNFVNSTVAPTIISPDSVQWVGLPVLSPFQSGSMVVTFNLSPTTITGSNVYSQCVIEPITNDANPSCNYANDTSIVTAAFDPNDVLVSEDTLTTTQLASQPYLGYTIRFQNTGNDTAFTVKIINPIDTNKLGLSSMEFVTASHPVNLKWVNYNRNMEFLFSNILLPDSNVNEPMSHGFVHYRIKPKTTLLAGDSITNKAYIYFDFNAPVETNTAVTKIVLPTGISDWSAATDRNGDLKVYPNPANDVLNIQLNNHRPRPAYNPITIFIFDVLGNLIRKEISTNPKSEIRNLNSLSPGIYFIEVKNGTDIYRAKFVKE